MKVLILTLLVLNSLCFSLGDKDEKKNDFIDLDADEGEQLEDEQPEDYVDEEQNDMDELEDDDDSQEDEGNDEPEDPNGFKDDSIEDAAKNPDDAGPLPVPQNINMKEPTGTPPSEEPGSGAEPLEEINMKEPTGTPPSEEPGSGAEPLEEDADLKAALEDKLGLK